MSTVKVDYFLRLSGRFGSTDTLKDVSVGVDTGVVSSTGAPNSLPKSSAGVGAGAVGCAQDCSVLYPCVRGGALTHCD